MIEVTEQAKAALLALMRAAGIQQPEVGLRLKFGADGTLGLFPDRLKAGDEVVTYGEASVLLVDPAMSALVITGRIIDCRRIRADEVEFFLRRRAIGEGRSFVA